MTEYSIEHYLFPPERNWELVKEIHIRFLKKVAAEAIARRYEYQPRESQSQTPEVISGKKVENSEPKCECVCYSFD